MLFDQEVKKVLTSRVSNDIKKLMVDPKEIIYPLNVQKSMKNRFKKFKNTYAGVDSHDKTEVKDEETKFNSDMALRYE